MNKPFNRALTYGRFNLCHKGHVELFRRMAEQTDTLVIGLSTAKSNLSFSDRHKVISKALEGIGVELIFYPAKDPFTFLEKAGVETHDLFLVGEDQVSLSNAVAKYSKCFTSSIKRMTSSTVVRALIDSEEWDVLAETIPPEILPDVVALRAKEIEKAAF